MPTVSHIFFISALLCVVLLLVLGSLLRSGIAGVREWFAANAVAGVAFILYAMGKDLPPLIAYEVANGVYAIATAALETDDANELRDFTFDALFFVNMAELSWLYERFYRIDEARFWHIVRGVLQAYQDRHPHLAERYRLFDCFAGEVSIELLASRRFQTEIRLRTRLAPNPLASRGTPPWR